MKIKMTDQALAKQKPKDDRYEVWDTLVSNLMVTVFPSGKKTWSVRYRSDGKRVKMKLGDYPNLALSDARRKAKDVLVSVADGENPAYEKHKKVKAKSRTRQTLQISNLLELAKSYTCLSCVQDTKPKHFYANLPEAMVT